MNVGDRVLLVSGGVSVFEILELHGDQALVEAIQADAPGRYPFETPIEHLVLADLE